jgi:hypothetical protein
MLAGQSPGKVAANKPCRTGNQNFHKGGV